MSIVYWTPRLGFFLRFQERKVYDEVFSFSQQAMLNYMLKNQEKKEEKEFMDNVS